VAREKAWLVKMLEKVGGLQVFPSETNFLLIRILRKGLTSTKLKEDLAKKGILIRDCRTFVGLNDSYFRVTVRSKKENQILIESLKETVA
jgi:threonine-phosphate decarboxylase